MTTIIDQAYKLYEVRIKAGSLPIDALRYAASTASNAMRQSGAKGRVVGSFRECSPVFELRPL